jgi:hypothetical protein
MGEDLVDLDRAIFNPLDPSDRLGHGVPSSVVERKVGALLTHVRTIRNWNASNRPASLYLVLFRKA